MHEAASGLKQPHSRDLYMLDLGVSPVGEDADVLKNMFALAWMGESRVIVWARKKIYRLPPLGEAASAIPFKALIWSVKSWRQGERIV